MPLFVFVSLVLRVAFCAAIVLLVFAFCFSSWFLPRWKMRVFLLHFFRPSLRLVVLSHCCLPMWLPLCLPCVCVALCLPFVCMPLCSFVFYMLLPSVFQRFGLVLCCSTLFCRVCVPWFAVVLPCVFAFVFCRFCFACVFCFWFRLRVRFFVCVDLCLVFFLCIVCSVSGFACSFGCG